MRAAHLTLLLKSQALLKNRVFLFLKISLDIYKKTKQFIRIEGAVRQMPHLKICGDQTLRVGDHGLDFYKKVNSFDCC